MRRFLRRLLDSAMFVGTVSLVAVVLGVLIRLCYELGGSVGAIGLFFVAVVVGLAVVITAIEEL